MPGGLFSVALSADHPGSALPTTMPCGARTFLTGTGVPARPPGRLARRLLSIGRASYP